ncbi:MAG: iron-containing alcohol dehydrogenase [Alphaproteobacteria bacterium]|nr:iron-containing alcohol dehydrogenase [Alphaproteobacteria bacterium]
MATITYLTKIQFEFGAVQLLASEMAELGMSRPLLVTDKGIRAAGLLDRVMEQLPNQCPAEIFDGTPENPTEAAMTAALAQYREADCDGVIGIGGGSSMDLAKAIALMATHPGELSEYMMIMGGAPKITDAIAPVIAIPTTAGTGSEVGRGAIMILNDGRKLGFGSPHVIPKVALCDPELTFSMPKMLTAGTGMDAFAHCFETFCASAINPPADAIATDGLGRAIRFIEQAVADGSDKEARWQMMMASMEGAMAFQKGLGAVHGMSHPLGSIKDPVLHHGTLNAVCLPAVIRYNADAVGDKYDWVKRIWGLPDNANLAEEGAALNARLGLPANLREMGVDEAMVEPLIPHAVADHTTASNPRPLAAADYQALFKETLG